MKPRVLIAPAPLREIQHVYGPAITAAGAELVFPKGNAQMTEAELIEQLPGCVASLAGSEPYTRAVIAAAAAKGLKVIARAGVGYDAVDLQAATDHGVAVTFAPGTNQDSVAEHTFTLILALARNLVTQHNAIAAGQWPRRANLPLRGSTLGVLGLGRIGSRVAAVGRAFGMDVLGWSPHLTPERAAEAGARAVPLDELLGASDVVTVHLVLGERTRGLLGAAALAAMKPDALLVNTSRGPIVDQTALLAALGRGHLGGVGLDVYDEEPLPADHPLRSAPRTLLTPHLGYVTGDLYRTFFTQAVEDVVAFADGAPVRQL
jgi:D-3-phosphoglycerate dehydrogenase / 2-oxoglutarate reductase